VTSSASLETTSEAFSQQSAAINSVVSNPAELTNDAVAAAIELCNATMAQSLEAGLSIGDSTLLISTTSLSSILSSSMFNGTSMCDSDSDDREFNMTAAEQYFRLMQSTISNVAQLQLYGTFEDMDWQPQIFSMLLQETVLLGLPLSTYRFRPLATLQRLVLAFQQHYLAL